MYYYIHMNKIIYENSELYVIKCNIYFESCATQTETKRTIYNVRTVTSGAAARTSDPKNLKEDHKFNQYEYLK